MEIHMADIVIIPRNASIIRPVMVDATQMDSVCIIRRNGNSEVIVPLVPRHFFYGECRRDFTIGKSTVGRFVERGNVTLAQQEIYHRRVSGCNSDLHPARGWN